MDQFNVMSINDDITLFLTIRSVPNVEAKFLIGGTKKVLGRVLILVNPNEVVCDTTDGDSCRICEHVIYSLVVTSLKGFSGPQLEA
jgi:hypothetical protein